MASLYEYIRDYQFSYILYMYHLLSALEESKCQSLTGKTKPTLLLKDKN